VCGTAGAAAIAGGAGTCRRQSGAGDFGGVGERGRAGPAHSRGEAGGEAIAVGQKKRLTAENAESAEKNAEMVRACSALDASSAVKLPKPPPTNRPLRCSTYGRPRKLCSLPAFDPQNRSACSAGSRRRLAAGRLVSS